MNGQLVLQLVAGRYHVSVAIATNKPFSPSPSGYL